MASQAELGRGRDRSGAPSVWTRAANPWQEALAAENAGPAPTRRRSTWQRLLSWLIEYNRY